MAKEDEAARDGGVRQGIRHLGVLFLNEKRGFGA